MALQCAFALWRGKCLTWAASRLMAILRQLTALFPTLLAKPIDWTVCGTSDPPMEDLFSNLAGEA